MQHMIARRTIRWVFDRLSAREPEELFARCHSDIQHQFAGHHALGGTRHSKEAFEAWLKRLFRLFPKLVFEPSTILVAGPPWHMVIGVHWTDRGEAADGHAYENSGVHEIRLKWGKLVCLRAHLDIQHLVDALHRMAANGIEEAAQEPIGDRP